MTVGPFLRTIDLAQAIQVSVQQVRHYEASGFLPPVERSPTGYRRYTHQHLAALKTAKHLVDGYGWQWAQQIMQAVHQGKLVDAFTLIDERHAELAKTRGQLEQTAAALHILGAQSTGKAHGHTAERKRVGAAADLVGVPISTLRFWEQQGLLHPTREAGSNYRCYDEQQLRCLQIVALLRQANYDVAAIRETLEELESGQPQRAVAAVEQRRSQITIISWRCLEASAALHGYLCEFFGDQTP